MPHNIKVSIEVVIEERVHGEKVVLLSDKREGILLSTGTLRKLVTLHHFLYKNLKLFGPSKVKTKDLLRSKVQSSG